MLLNANNLQHHITSEGIVNLLCSRTQSVNKLFFRVMVGYYFSVLASMMRTNIKTHDRGIIPVNMYALNLSPSGSGKGFSMNIIENEIIHLFRENFINNTFQTEAELNLPKLALIRGNRKRTDPDEELERVRKEFDALGHLMFSFDSGTSPAVKQMRQKLLMANAGSMNLQIDEIGSNLVSNLEVLNTFLELFDVGNIKQKLIKNTSDNTRSEEIYGKTPTNMLMFGTPSKLLNGGKVEEELYSMLETGYARRCFFGYTKGIKKQFNLTPEQIYDHLTNEEDNKLLNKLALEFEALANPCNMNRVLRMSKETSIEIIRYRLECEQQAELYNEHEEIQKAELSHRYFKALKLAGAYAFIDNSNELTIEHLHSAIKLADESGTAFFDLLARERPYVKLARYISTVRHEVTQADLVEDLPFYKGSIQTKQEMMQLAIAYGYKNNIIIKKSFIDNIEFFKGESLTATDLRHCRVSYSTDYTTNYVNKSVAWEQLFKLAITPDIHWTNHFLLEGYRNEDHCEEGFNLVVIDVDEGVTLEAAKELLKEYKYLLYTTKRSTEEYPRFRIIFPTNYVLKLDSRDYKEFMTNVYSWLPFEVDTQTNQRSRKWLSCDNGQYFYNDGELLDILEFIPKTSKNTSYKNKMMTYKDLNNLERWIVSNMQEGNRNNMLLRFALILKDQHLEFEEIRLAVLALNKKLPNKLDETEIANTILVSLAKAMSNCTSC